MAIVGFETAARKTSMYEQSNHLFLPSGENFILKIWVEPFRSYPGDNWALTLLALSPALPTQKGDTIPH